MSAAPELRIETFRGADVSDHLADVARLRSAVFGDWPYLYAGDPGYEEKYLATYAVSPASVFVLAFDGARVVGASTGVPLADEVAAFQAPFLARGLELADVFYFGESVLLREYRGRGIGHRFFEERERHARSLGGFMKTAFCAVERDPDDARQPAGFRPNDALWNKRGYTRQEDMFCELEWQEIGQNAPQVHRLRFWMRDLEAA